MEMGKYTLRLKYDLDDVLEMAECRKEDPNYNKYKDELKALIADHPDIILPQGYVVPSQVGGQDALFCMVSLGGEIDAVVAKCFETYDYLGGMMMNAFGDVVLFEATNHLYELLKEDMKDGSLYLSNRVEPGTSEADMTMQKVIYDVVVPAFDLDLRITEGYMLAPAKTLAYYYKLTEEDCSMGIDHDCSSCDSKTCKHRKYLLKVHKGDAVEVIQARKGDNLLEVLRNNNVLISAPCGGMGTCGKCKITVKDHGYDLSENERRFLTESEEASNVLLACYHQIDRDLSIFPPLETKDDEIETGYQAFKIKCPKYDPDLYIKEHYPIGLAVDIGTTTLAVSLVNMVTHQVLDLRKTINPQKAYGADIISRIMYVGAHKDDKLSGLIRSTIEEMSAELIDGQGYNKDHIEEMVISGNTTMIYLLLGMDPQALAVAPFTTVDKGLMTLTANQLFKRLGDFKVTILPWISAYVGGDITSGMYATHLIDQEATLVFIDIGTNGEMVLRTKDRMISAATAAGPAFEGANIKCGMASVSGAICEIKAKGQGYEFVTLGGKNPQGICGSALIDGVALLHKQGYVDDMGYMAEPVMLAENIGIYPEDIRQVQLAKAAIMAGVDVLLDEAGLTYKDIDAFYIAGGFGSHVNIANCAYIGLISKEVEDKVTVVGNTSLAGSVRYLLEKDGAEEVETLRQTCEYVELSTNMKFNEAYVMGMTFGDFTF